MDYLAEGTRYKVSGYGDIKELPPSVRGRWVALVLADNDCHMKAAGDDELLRRSLRLIQAQLTLLELYGHPALDESSEAAKAIKALKKRLEE